LDRALSVRPNAAAPNRCTSRQNFVRKMECKDKFHLQGTERPKEKPLHGKRETGRQSGSGAGRGDQAEQLLT